MDIIRNPIIIGILAGGLVFAYLKYTNESDKKKKQENFFPVLIPTIVFVCTWLISYAYFEYSLNKSTDNSIDVEDSYKVIGRSIQIPSINDLPDVSVKIDG